MLIGASLPADEATDRGLDLILDWVGRDSNPQPTPQKGAVFTVDGFAVAILGRVASKRAPSESLQIQRRSILHRELSAGLLVRFHFAPEFIDKLL